MNLKVFAFAAALAVPLLLFAQEDRRFERFDKNRDGAIEPGEWRGTNQRFDQVDTNHDDRITREEFMARNNPGSTDRGRFQSLDRNDSQVIEGHEWPYNRQMFHELDSNRDSVLSRDEFTRLNNATLKQLDRNNDGSISSDEWPGGFASFEQLDTDRNGTITAREYLNRGSEFEKEQRFQAWDTNKSGALEGTEWRSDTKLFHLLDRNQDSVLSLDEMMDRDRTAWIQGLDANRDNLISGSEWRGSTQSFQRLDRNGNGTLESGELNYSRSDRNLQSRFYAMDSNRDGMIQRGEWQGNVNRFHRLDRDSNGVLTAGEFFSRGSSGTSGD